MHEYIVLWLLLLPLSLPLLVHHLACYFCIHVFFLFCFVLPSGLDRAICVALVPDDIPVGIHLKTVVPC